MRDLDFRRLSLQPFPSIARLAFFSKKKNSPFSFSLYPPPATSPFSSPPQSVLAELRSLRASSPDGVVSIPSVDAFERFTEGARGGRGHGLVVFCTAKHLLDKPQLGLRKMRREFGTVAKTARRNLAEYVKSSNASSPASPLDTLFFATLDFESAREAFHRLGVQSLPWVISVSPDAAVPPDGDIEILGDAVMRHARYGHRHWSAADFARFASDRVEAWRNERMASEGFAAADGAAAAAAAADFPPAIVIHEAPPRPSVVNVVLGLSLLSALAAIGWKLYNSALARSYPLWTVGALAVWWFSTSGGMYNIIRGMPMVLPQRDGTVKLFLDGSGQVGFEGFLMGTLYASVGLSFFALSAAATRLSDEGGRRVAGYVALCLAWFAYRRVVSIHDWKTSFGWHSFLW